MKSAPPNCQKSHGIDTYHLESWRKLCKKWNYHPLERRSAEYFLQDVRAQERVYFLHIPKTAGSFVSEIENKVRGKWCKEIVDFHGKKKYCKKIVGLTSPNVGKHTTVQLGVKEPNDAMIFVVVRNPYDWLVSMYSHTKKFNVGWANSRRGIGNFKEYVMKLFQGDLVADNPWSFLVKNFAMTPYFQILDATGVIQVDFVIRYEFLTQALALLHGVDEKIISELPKINASPSRNNRHYKEYYDDSLIAQVEEQYSRSLEVFGYNFDGPVDSAAIIFNTKGTSIIG